MELYKITHINKNGYAIIIGSQQAYLMRGIESFLEVLTKEKAFSADNWEPPNIFEKDFVFPTLEDARKYATFCMSDAQIHVCSAILKEAKEDYGKVPESVWDLQGQILNHYCKLKQKHSDFIAFEKKDNSYLSQFIFFDDISKLVN
ncbi:MAG: hypothetical protein KKF46_00055 [Nanoarchaeota archaeon]|nr:hypothetical protein [Nanoarchaeota archaeon]MBU1320726.1 hypothetical protein [Nanoarchaeota archaeon]MBU1598275.1 hypothetical protein [Nanoarchaeota archaeon]MBU2442163.1 hypothetical protein [Nanoarchaeota archaeon]